MWGTTGIGYNVDKIKGAMPDAPVDSLAMIYDPAVVSRSRPAASTSLDGRPRSSAPCCSTSGKRPDSEGQRTCRRPRKVLMAVRPYIRYVQAAQYLDDLANGEICLALGWSG